MKSLDIQFSATDPIEASKVVACAARAAARGGEADRAAGGVALSPTALVVGRREAPALDLSLGHFGTGKRGDDLFEVDFVFEGPYALELDYTAMKATLTFDSQDPSSRIERRAALRKVEKFVRTAIQSGMAVVRETV